MEQYNTWPQQMTAAGPQPFAGRRCELESLRGLLAAAVQGRPGVAVVRGPAGSGKTRLVQQLLAGLRGRPDAAGPDNPTPDARQPDLRQPDAQQDTPLILRATGSAWEQDLDGGVLEQLLAGLPASEEAFSGAGGERLLAAGTAPAGPALLVVDNLQWVDEASLRALLFAHRRLRNQRLLIILLLRDEDAYLLPEPFRALLEDPAVSLLPLGPLSAADILDLAAAGPSTSPAAGLTDAAAHRLAAYCGGNPRHVLQLLREHPPQLWKQWQRDLPAPRELVHDAGQRLRDLPASARRLVEAAAVLGTTSALAEAAALADVADPLPELTSAAEQGLLTAAGEGGRFTLSFGSEVRRNAVYHSLCLARRTALHLDAARLLTDRGASLRHRAAAALLPDARLAAELQAYAADRARDGAWSTAADALVTASRLLPGGRQHEDLLLRAVDAIVAAGELPRALAYADEIAQYRPSPLRDAVAGYQAILQGRESEADQQLTQAWNLADPDADPGTAALIAQRRVLDSLARWNGSALLQWAERAGALAEPDSPAAVESAAIRGLGLAAAGRISEAEASYAMLADRPGGGAQAQRVRMGRGWLQLALDRPETAREDLASAVSTDFSAGSFRISLWARAWLARSEFALGDWAAALRTVDSAVVLQRSTGMELVRPLLHWTAVQIHALRGDEEAAAKHLHLGRAGAGDYPIMLLPYRIAQAQAAEARTDFEAVLRALEPVVGSDRCHGLDEPGFWPWHDLYAKALVMTDQLAEAEAFLTGPARMTAARGHRSATARLASARGRLLGSRGELDAAKDAFGAALTALHGVNLPYERARVDFAYGQTLRRAGKRRESVAPLRRAREAFSALGAGLLTDRCDRELLAAGIGAPRREAADWSALTAQESAVVRLVAAGASNKQAAQELFVSVKTVQYHLTRVYAKLGLTSRTELAARFRAAGSGTAADAVQAGAGLSVS
ncbi:Putative HTH-type transcriptional regulatorc/MT0914 [Arthrobacter saudimassiliensis]|uniref:Putative HTH-type transcriptional regulatorc/MT0914 n=1 Tax=Arthrobacter saudimassiliensis TaxID=1461584 RepID=A0A078MXW7_9MICC|nr:Putative HTH-type transcriptional regulatorc/MT0914 [Arthrobacter saudimassiliensis]